METLPYLLMKALFPLNSTVFPHRGVTVPPHEGIILETLCRLLHAHVTLGYLASLDAQDCTSSHGQVRLDNRRRHPPGARS